MKKKSHDIYISYSRNDKDAYDKIAQILSDNGFSVWCEENLTSGMLYGDAIQDAILKSKVIIAICSKWSMNSVWIKNELGFAKEKGVPVIDVLTDNPKGLEGIGNIDAELEMQRSSFEVDLLFIIRRYGVKSDTELFATNAMDKKDNEEHQIFISYKRDDSGLVFKIKDKIELNTGKKCWIDLDGIESDAQFVNVIIKAINKAEVFLFMYSHSHTEITDYKKDWTVREISFAEKKNKRIVFVNIDNTALTDWFEMMFGQQQQVDATSNSALERLYRDLKKWLYTDKNIISKDIKTNAALNDNANDSTRHNEGVDIGVNIQKGSLSEETLRVKLGNVQFDMIRVEGGQLEIGATDEQEPFAEKNEYPAHLVNLPTFYIGQYPVTQNLWEKVMGYNHSHNQQSEKELVFDMERKKVQAAVMNAMNPTASSINNMDTDYGHYPVENLSYNEAIQFVRRLSELTDLKFDLPTEEEWEYAARGGQKSRHYRYAGSNNIDDVAWYRQNSDLKTHRVGEKQPNELGIYDMSGNVWEWTKSKAHRYDRDVDPEEKLFIRRGGSAIHVEKNCRVSFRYETERSKHNMGSGLRVVIRENIDK